MKTNLRDFECSHSSPCAPERLILTYLIPCRLLTSHTLPSPALLKPYPTLQELFLPLSRCIKKGELHAFDLALQAGEETFVKRRIYLTLERGRDVALRNLLRKVFLAGGFEESKDPNAAPIRRTRVPVAEFSAAISLNSQQSLDSDEVECLLANMIYKVRSLSSLGRKAWFANKAMPAPPAPGLPQAAASATRIHPRLRLQ